MNGTDWPSPVANLSMVEQQIHKVLAATGIDVPSLATGSFLKLLMLFFVKCELYLCDHVTKLRLE